MQSDNFFRNSLLRKLSFEKMSCTREIGYVTRYEEIIEDDYVKINSFYLTSRFFEKIQVENSLNKYPHNLFKTEYSNIYLYSIFFENNSS